MQPNLLGIKWGIISMTKLLMIQEEHFVKDAEGNIYATRVLNEEIFNRYLEYFDQLVVFARISNSNHFISELKVNTTDIEFIGIPDFRGPKGLLLHSREIISKFREACKKTDMVFLRAPSMLTLFLYRFIPRNKWSGVEFMMGATYFIESESFFSKIVNRVIDREAKRLVKKVNGTIYVTKEKLQEEYPPNHRALNHDDAEFFSYGVSDVVLDKEFLYERPRITSEKKSFVLVSVGFMDSYRKGQHLLIKAVKELKEKGYNVELKLIGEGSKQEEFERLAKKLEVDNMVHFLGKISSREVLARELKESDIFLLPSKLEGLPRVIIEALAVGLPVIASNVNGNSELVQEKLLVDDFEVSNYVGKIQSLINDIELYNNISKENYQKSMTFFPEKLNPERREFFKKLAELSKRKK